MLAVIALLFLAGVSLLTIFQFGVILKSGFANRSRVRHNEET